MKILAIFTTSNFCHNFGASNIYAVSAKKKPFYHVADIAVYRFIRLEIDIRFDGSTMFERHKKNSHTCSCHSAKYVIWTSFDVTTKSNVETTLVIGCIWKFPGRVFTSRRFHDVVTTSFTSRCCHNVYTTFATSKEVRKTFIYNQISMFFRRWVSTGDVLPSGWVQNYFRFSKILSLSNEYNLRAQRLVNVSGFGTIEYLHKVFMWARKKYSMTICLHTLWRVRTLMIIRVYTLISLSACMQTTCCCAF